MTSSSAPSFSASHAAGPPAWRSRTRRFPRRSADRRSRAERTGAGDPAALRAAVRVPGRGLFEVDPGLVRQRHEPGQDVTDLLDEAAEGAVATATLVAVEIRPAHQVLELGQVHRVASSWSGRRDLNPRPQRPERCALPSCATSRRAQRAHRPIVRDLPDPNRATHPVGPVAGEVAAEQEGSRLAEPVCGHGGPAGRGGGPARAGGGGLLADLGDPLDLGVAEDELVVDGVLVSEDEPNGLALLDRDGRRGEPRVPQPDLYGPDPLVGGPAGRGRHQDGRQDHAEGPPKVHAEALARRRTPAATTSPSPPSTRAATHAGGVPASM